MYTRTEKGYNDDHKKRPMILLPGKEKTIRKSKVIKSRNSLEKVKKILLLPLIT